MHFREPDGYSYEIVENVEPLTLVKTGWRYRVFHHGQKLSEGDEQSRESAERLAQNIIALARAGREVA